MESLTKTYDKRLDFLSREIKRASARLSLWSTLRFFSFFLFLVSVYFLEVYNTIYTYVVTAVLLLSFAVFLYFYFKTKSTLKDLEVSKSVLSRMKSLKEGGLSDLGNGSEFRPDVHEYEFDLDLLGESSIFQRINLCFTQKGQKSLSDLLLDNRTELSWERKLWVKELEANFEFRFDFLKALDKKNIKGLNPALFLGFLSSFKFPNVNTYLLKMFPWVSLFLLSLVIFTDVNYSLMIIWGILGLSITGKYIKSINDFSDKTFAIEDFLNAQSEVLTLFIDQNWSSKIAVGYLQKIRGEHDGVTNILKLLSRRISNLDQRLNMFFGVLANAFLLWDLNQLRFIKAWYHKHGRRLEAWTLSMAELEAWVSLSTYSSHLDGVYAEQSDKSMLIEAVNLGHPLIPKDQRVGNGLVLEQGSLWIITGANMAGKSTFLRSIGWSVVSANLGIRVCADRFLYQPTALVSSMRTSDSLISRSSYFQAELKRLSFVKDKLEQGRYLVLLDEILKGTNSTDKAEGSMRFLRKIHTGKSTILVATHDLSLCELEQGLSKVKNFAFEASFVEDEMSFDYKLKQGVCTDMNASYLLKKLGLT